MGDLSENRNILNKCSLDILVAMVEILNSQKASDKEFRRLISTTAENIKKMELKTED